MVGASGVVVVPVQLATAMMLMMRMLVREMTSVLVLVRVRFSVIAMPVMIATAVALHALRRLSDRCAHQRDGKQRQNNGGKEQAAARHYRKKECFDGAAAERALKRKQRECDCVGRGGVGWFGGGTGHA